MLRKINKPEFIFIISNLAILIVVGHFFSFLCPYILSKDECEINYLPNTEGLFKTFIAGSIVGPLIETLIFQYLPITLLHKFRINKSAKELNLIIIISSLIFGITHSYNILTVIDASIAGLIFCTVFVYFQKRNKSGFFYTFLLHGLFNTYAFILDDVLNVG
ncbi:MAG: CPBP family glutamic-type intramembrane protease [Hydrotalea sp.]|nr:CPBP family glutamic-type intramembrane protease [Hydrotalea sp.]